MVRLVETLANQIAAYSYTAVFVFLFSLSFALPISEEVALIIVGFFVYKGDINLWITLIVGYIGIIGGDVFLYTLSRFLGGKIIRTKFISRLINPDRIIKGEKFFEKHGAKAILSARFLVGIRSTMFVAAGLMKMNFVKFLTYDSLAGLIFVPVMILVGFLLGNQFREGVSVAERIGNILTVITVLGGGGYFIWRLRKKTIKELEEEDLKDNTKEITPDDNGQRSDENKENS